MADEIKKIVITIFLFVLSNNFLHAQMQDELKQRIEKYLENTESTSDFTQVLEDLSAYLDKPINLNTTTVDELINFPLISQVQAINIVAHRDKFGLFLSINELQVIGIPVDQIQILTPFVTVQPTAAQQFKDLKRQLKQGSSELVTTAKYKTPVPKTNPYLGNLWNQNLRFRYNIPGLYSFGITADKDPGEAYWRKGPDFVSVHASIQNIGIIKMAVAGDYLLSIGQGLVMGSGIGMGKSAMVMNIKRSAPNLKPYRGVNEFFYLRGAAVSLQWKKWNLIASGAVNKLDARTGDTSISQNYTYSSLDLDGLHRNNTELAAKGNLTRSMTGAWLQRQGKRGSWGMGGNYWLSDRATQTYSDLYRQFYPSGKSLSFINIFQAHTLGRFHIFSEWAYCTTNQTKAMVAGLLTSLGKNAEFSLLYRNYQSGFVSPFSTAFGNGNQNEKGLYTGLKINFNRKLWLSSYADLWVNPWLGYHIYAPARGTDMLMQLDYTPTKLSQVYIRWRVQNKPYNSTEAMPLRAVAENKISTLRVHFSAPVNSNLNFQMRGENSIATVPGAIYKSSMAFVQFEGKIRKTKTLVSCRYTLFNVPFYYNRMFVFESQLMYDFGTLALYGKGTEFYLLLSQKVSKKWKAGLRYSAMQSILPNTVQTQLKQGIFVQLFCKI